MRLAWVTDSNPMTNATISDDVGRRLYALIVRCVSHGDKGEWVARARASVQRRVAHSLSIQEASQCTVAIF
jgi:hypothetical protein